MNSILSMCLSLNLLFNAFAFPTLFAVTPNPFVNTSIQYNFHNANTAAAYYYNQITNNVISYSDSDLLVMHCVLANIYLQDHDSIDPDLITRIENYYENSINVGFWGSHTLAFYNMLGYILKPTSNFFDWLYNYQYQKYNWLSVPHIHYFANLYDNFTFDRYTIEPSTSLIADIDASANSVQSVPYISFSVVSTSYINYSSLSWFNIDLYNSFSEDLTSFSKDHKLFTIRLFTGNDAYLLNSSNTKASSIDSGIWGYAFISLDKIPVFILDRQVRNGFRFDFYNSDWTSFTDYQSSFLCKFLASSNSSITVADSSYILCPYQISSGGFNLGSNELVRAFFKYKPDTDYFYPFFNTVSGSGSSCINLWFSNYFDSLVYFPSLQSFKDYSLANGLYFKATDVNNTSVSYSTYNNYTSLVNSNNTTYNSVNKYFTDNSITTIDNSTQTIINNYFNFDLEFNFDIVINNIKEVEQSESDYINSFQQYFNDSGYKDFNFTSWSSGSNGETATFGQFSPVITLLNVYYNNLPSKLQMVLAGVLAVGLFGMILGVAARIAKSKGD